VGPRISAVRLDAARISDKTVWSFVRVTAGEFVGTGEATLPGQEAAVAAALVRLGQVLAGEPADPRQRVFDRLGSATPPLAEAAAASALDQALWDIEAQRRGLRLAEALGQVRRQRVPLYANVNRRTVDRRPQGFAASARDALAKGMQAFKIAPFDGLTPANASNAEGEAAIAAGIERIAAVRDAIGPERPLMVDCHWRFDEARALSVLSRLEPLRLFWFECPVPETADNFGAIRRIRSKANALGMRLAGLELEIGVDGFRRFVEADLYDVIMPDVKYAGGLREMLAIAEWPAAGFEDTELGVLMEPEVCHGATEVYARVQG
jgi:galactonate dehydratase